MWAVQTTAEDATQMENASTAGTNTTSTTLISPVSRAQLFPTALTASQEQANAPLASQAIALKTKSAISNLPAQSQTATTVFQATLPNAIHAKVNTRNRMQAFA